LKYRIAQFCSVRIQNQKDRLAYETQHTKLTRFKSLTKYCSGTAATVNPAAERESNRRPAVLRNSRAGNAETTRAATETAVAGRRNGKTLKRRETPAPPRTLAAAAAAAIRNPAAAQNPATKLSQTTARRMTTARSYPARNGERERREEPVGS